MTGIESCRKGDKRMKQAEHPPVTAGANSAAEYSLALIDQLARIDRTCSKEEMDELVCRLLSLIGEAMLSGRVFLFERLEGTAEAYCNTFEWCANGVAPQIDNLTEIVPADMPYWLEVFGRGETRSPFVTSGVRLGTPAVTTRGMGEAEMKVIADCIADCIWHYDEKKDDISARVLALTKAFPLYE